MATPPAPRPLTIIRPLAIIQRPPQTHLKIARVVCIVGELVVLAMSIMAMILIRSTGIVEFLVGFNLLYAAYNLFLLGRITKQVHQSPKSS
jgi:hypothetical protein